MLVTIIIGWRRVVVVGRDNIVVIVGWDIVVVVVGWDIVVVVFGAGDVACLRFHGLAALLSVARRGLDDLPGAQTRAHTAITSLWHAPAPGAPVRENAVVVAFGVGARLHVACAIRDPLSGRRARLATILCFSHDRLGAVFGSAIALGTALAPKRTRAASATVWLRAIAYNAVHSCIKNSKDMVVDRTKH
jgi:hypothetical protein